MNKEKIKPLFYGIALSLPFVSRFRKKQVVGGTNARYCYAVWMRHLVTLNEAAPVAVPNIIAEVGPGNSIGCGMAALLSGCEKYYGLDVVKYWDQGDINLTVFEEMLELFKSRAPIPGESEFPRITPTLKSYAFPHHILTDELLEKALADDRVAQIRQNIGQLNSSNETAFISIFIPWYDARVIARETIDFIFSQAVFEHVEDLENSYQAMYEWLKPGGYMAHSIDFWSHGITPAWDGHWSFSALEWKIVKGRRSFFINRAPLSRHIKLHNDHHFSIKKIEGQQRKPETPDAYIANDFKGLTPDDRNNMGAYMLSQKQA